MPRKIPSTITLDEAEDEILFTIAALKADPDAAELVSMTGDWLSLVDAARKRDRAARQAQMEADAARVVANDRLDRACERFGDELFLAVEKDRKSARWVQFFSVAVSKFVRQRLDKQVQKVRGWLESSDGVLDKHRGPLDTWSKAAGEAVQKTHAVAMVRGEARIAREEMAEDLTRERDGLHDALSGRAREIGLPRDWPDLFFRTMSRSAPEEAESPPAAPPPASPGG
jgi:hypothetical protein